MATKEMGDIYTMCRDIVATVTHLGITAHSLKERLGDDKIATLTSGHNAGG